MSEAKAADVRKMHWYSHYRHTVFNMIQSCFENDGASGVVLIGIQPTLQNVMTCAEWPCIMQDLQTAFEEKKAPFYQKGEQKLDFTKINFKRISIQDLGDELEVSTRRSKYAIIASCSEDNFEAAAAAVTQHNTSTRDGCGKVRTAWATAEDVYGDGNHPPKAGGYAPEAFLKSSHFDGSRAQVDAKLDEGIYRFSTSKWAKCFMYMQDKKRGNVRGWDQEDPGPQGWFRLRRVADAAGSPSEYWFIEPLAFQKWSVYMQDSSDGNVCGCDGDPGPQGHWKIQTHQMEEGTYRFSTKQWPTHYMYMQDNSEGNVRGYEGDPGSQGWWHLERSLFPEMKLFEPETSQTYRMTTAKWSDCYMYMQDTKDGNVRGWNKEDPGPQGHFKFIRCAKDLWLIHPVKWPTWHAYMQDNKDGNVCAWEGDPGPQGHWRIEAHMFEKDVFRLTPSRWPNDVMYMQDNSDGNVRSWKSDAGPQGWWYISPV